MGIVHPHLWFDDNALEAAQFYVSIFPNSSIVDVLHAPADMPGVTKGDPFVVHFLLDGQPGGRGDVQGGLARPHQVAGPQPDRAERLQR